MHIQEALAVIGLNEKESAVYMALLQLGRVSAYSISEKSGLKKPTTYVILDELIRKGLVVKVPREKKKLYVARPPEEVFRVAEEKFKSAQQKLPELLALTKGDVTKVSTFYFEGLNGLKQTMEYGLKNVAGKEIVGFYAMSEGLPKNLIDYLNEWTEKRLRQKITMRGIVPDHDSLKSYRATDKEEGRIMKIVPYEKFSSQIAIDVAGDCVRIHDYKNLQGVVIDNKDVAKTMREVFEMLWTKY